MYPVYILIKTLPQCKQYLGVSSDPLPIQSADHATPRFEVWATKILAAIDNQGRVLSDLAQTSKDGLRQQPSPHPSQFSVIEDDDLETMSRKDISWTPITGSDMILSWSVFPTKKPVDTFPAAAYVEKPHPLAPGMYKLPPNKSRKPRGKCIC